MSRLPYPDDDEAEIDVPAGAAAGGSPREFADRCGDHLSLLLGQHAKRERLGTVRRRAEFEVAGVACRVDVAYWQQGKRPGRDAPTLVAEVIGSSAFAPDHTPRFRAYAGGGVGELILIDPRAWSVEAWARLNRRGGGRHPARFVPGGRFRRTGSFYVLSLPQFSRPIEAVFDAEANLRAISGVE